jgi:Ran GTPase-activating protein (RanGAP) involved in mRNA processing and transport
LLYREDSDDDLCQLEVLNLESNSITDGAVGHFFSQAARMNSLTVLNLSKNCLGQSVAQKIKLFLMEDTTLAELYLHWCELNCKATKAIFEGLARNRGLKVLDVSWNQIGLDGVNAFCKCTDLVMQSSREIKL